MVANVNVAIHINSMFHLNYWCLDTMSHARTHAMYLKHGTSVV